MSALITQMTMGYTYHIYAQPVGAKEQKRNFISSFDQGSGSQQNNGPSIRGVIISAKKAEVSTSLGARVITLPFEMGDHFKKGDLLAEFDCSQLKAEYNAVKAAHHSLSLVQQNNEELLAYGAAGVLDVETAKADAARASAEIDAVKAQMRECAIYAPYTGYIVARYIDPFETPTPGTPLLSIIDNAPLEIQLIAPSKWLGWLSVDMSFSFSIDEVGKTYKAKVVRIGKSIDSVSQTINIVALFADDQVPAISGMSGTAIFLDTKRSNAKGFENGNSEIGMPNLGGL